MKHLTFLVLILSFLKLDAQDLNGVWQGKLTQEPGGCFPEYYIELQISSDNKEISGISYDYYDTSQFVKLNFTGGYNGNKKKILLSEKTIIKERIPADCAPCLKTYDLVYSKQNNVESLSGKWVGEDMGTIAGCPPGFIYLTKVKKSAFEERRKETELAKVFVVDSPNVQVDFLDNGVVDGDSISVFFDNQVVVSKQGLSLKPVTLNLSLQPQKEHELIVLSEGMGTITPTTALVVITSGIYRYQIFISADEKKNSSIKLIYNNKGGLTKKN